MKAIIFRICITVLFFAGGVFCIKADDAKAPIVGVAILPSKTSFTYGAFVFMKLAITNLSSDSITLPSFNFFRSDKSHPYGEFDIYEHEHILNLELSRDGNRIPGKYCYEIDSKLAGKYPSEELPPGGLVSREFSSGNYFDMTNGEYSLVVTLDTMTCKDTAITKGVWASPPVTLHISPRLTFRAKKLLESSKQYAISRVAFFLKASTPDFNGRPLYFPEIQATKGNVPALIELIDSPDKEVASSALELLRWTGHGDEGNPPDSKSKAAWEEWWQKTGSKIPESKIWERTSMQ